MTHTPLSRLMCDLLDRIAPTQHEQANALGVHLNTIHSWRHGKRRPQVQAVYDLCERAGQPERKTEAHAVWVATLAAESAPVES